MQHESKLKLKQSLELKDRSNVFNPSNFDEIDRMPTQEFVTNRNELETKYRQTKKHTDNKRFLFSSFDLCNNNTQKLPEVTTY